MLTPDIDECSTDTKLCHEQATCMDTDGSYTCTCKSGYTGDGETCNGKHVCVRSPYYVSGQCHPGGMKCSTIYGNYSDTMTCTCIHMCEHLSTRY